MEDHHDFSGYSTVAIKYTSLEILRYNSKINQYFASTFFSNYTVTLSRYSFYEVKLCSVCSFWEISHHNQRSYSSYMLKLLDWDEWNMNYDHDGFTMIFLLQSHEEAFVNSCWSKAEGRKNHKALLPLYVSSLLGNTFSLLPLEVVIE